MSAKSRGQAGVKRTQHETKEPVLRQAILRKVPTRIIARGEILLPAVPALSDYYVELLDQTFRATGRIFTKDELDYLRQTLRTTAERAFATSPYSRIRVGYQTDPLPKTTLTWSVDVQPSTLEDEYAEWVNTRTPPLFGEHPDAKVMDLSRLLGAPKDCPVLDVGAGTGRNTLPLARLGHPTDAVELAPALARILREEAAKESLDITVFEGNILDASLPIARERYRMMILAEVIASHFRTVEQVRGVFAAADRVLAPGGVLVFSAFIAHDGYKPDDFARQLSQVMWCCVFTKGQIQEAASGLPFEQVSNESTAQYEKAALPPEHWPPTGWYEAWTAGQDLFDLNPSKSPMELRWLVYRKSSNV
jgi:SAM-dependent methyltransferase